MEIPTSEKNFQEYKLRTERHVRIYNDLKSRFPLNDFPKLARIIWRMGMLAEMWGLLAPKLNKKGINYLSNWREGK